MICFFRKLGYWGQGRDEVLNRICQIILYTFLEIFIETSVKSGIKENKRKWVKKEG